MRLDGVVCCRTDGCRSRSAPRSPCARKMRKLTIAVDGPAGSGKSSVARRVAAMLGYLYLDSGAMYRAEALKALRQGIAPDDEARLTELARKTHIELRPPTVEQEAAGLKNRVFLDGRDVTQDIRTPEVARAASLLATIAGVREVLERDRRDRERKVSPLIRAKDAVLIDNTAMGIEETARVIVMLAHNSLPAAGSAEGTAGPAANGVAL